MNSAARLHVIHPKSAYRQALKLKRKEFAIAKSKIEAVQQPKTVQIPLLKSQKTPKIQLLKKDIKINPTHQDNVDSYRMAQITHLVSKAQDFVTFDNLEQKIEECIKMTTKPKIIKASRAGVMKDIMLGE